MKQISPDELRKRLNEGISHFAFKKKEGTMRIATGTLRLDDIPIHKHPTGVQTPTETAISYYDLDKEAWRRVNIEQEIFLHE